MAKTTGKEVEKVKTINSPVELQTAITKTLTNKENDQIIFGTLEAMDEGNFIMLTGDYYEFPEKTNGIIMVATGFSTIANKFRTETNGQPEEVTVVELKARDANGDVKEYVNADSVFVGSVQKAVEKGCHLPAAFIVNTYEMKESKANGKGKYLNMQVGIYTAPAVQ